MNFPLKKKLAVFGQKAAANLVRDARWESEEVVTASRAALQALESTKKLSDGNAFIKLCSGFFASFEKLTSEDWVKYQFHPKSLVVWP